MAVQFQQVRAVRHVERGEGVVAAAAVVAIHLYLGKVEAVLGGGESGKRRQEEKHKEKGCGTNVPSWSGVKIIAS